MNFTKLFCKIDLLTFFLNFLKLTLLNQYKMFRVLFVRQESYEIMGNVNVLSILLLL